MEKKMYSTLFTLTNYHSNIIWSQQNFKSSILTLFSKLDFNDAKYFVYQDTVIKINSLTRNLFFQFFHENEHLLEIFERIGYEFNFRNLFDELYRFICLKKIIAKYTLLSNEIDSIKKTVSIQIKYSKREKNKFFSKHSLVIKKNKRFLNINNIIVDKFMLYIGYFHLVIYSKKRSAIVFGQLKNLKIFQTFLYFVFFFCSFYKIGTIFLTLPKISCLVVKKSSFFFQLFCKKKNGQILNGLMVKIARFLYFLTLYIQTPLDCLEFCIKLKKNCKLNHYKQYLQNLNGKKTQSESFLKMISRTIYIFFLQKIYSEMKFNQYMISNFLHLILDIYKISKMKHLAEKLKINKFYSFFSLLNNNFKNRNQKSKKIILFVCKDIRMFCIRLKIRRLFRHSINVFYFLEIFIPTNQFIFFFKFFAKTLFLRCDYKIQLIIKYEAKKNKFELLVCSGKNFTGHYIPFHLLKNNKVLVNFCIQIKSQWQIFEILLGNRRTNVPSFCPFLISCPLTECIENDIVSLNTSRGWKSFLDLKKNKIISIFFSSIIFLEIFSSQIVLNIKRPLKIFPKKILLLVYFLKPILASTSLYWKNKWIDSIKLFKIINSFFLSFSSLVFYNLICNKVI